VPASDATGAPVVCEHAPSAIAPHMASPTLRDRTENQR
jgi:hypothetical protein